LPFRFPNLAKYWHLLSLDAPTVAGLWSWLFLRAMHQHWSLVQSMLLPLGTWLIYVSDRILDGLRAQDDSLRDRHHFYARHRTGFVTSATVVGAFLVWAVLTHMNRVALREDLWIGSLAFLYLCAVHQWRIHFPKELATGILFACATAVPAWSRLHGPAGKIFLAPAVVLFALLCWINCAGIERWEGGDPHPTTRWASLHLRWIASAIALLSFAAALLAPSYSVAALYVAALVSSGLLLALDVRSSRLKPLQLRIGADAALLTPLALFLFAR
jgi:hypothetical protein